MHTAETMELLIDYIDGRITQELTARELAEYTGYSFYHFCHLFKSYTGLPVGMYLRRRRMELAANDLLMGSKVTAVSLRYGFDTPAGFTKAFRKRYGISPSEYKARKGLVKMTPEIKKMEAFTAIGYKLAPPEGEFNVLDTSAYWLKKDYSSVSEEEYAKLASPNYGEIGAWMHPDDKTGAFYYFFGPIVKDTSHVPNGMEVMEVPSAEYAVFTVPPSDNPEDLHVNLRNTMKSIFTEWVDSSDYVPSKENILFEFFFEKEAFIYVPVTKG